MKEFHFGSFELKHAWEINRQNRIEKMGSQRKVGVRAKNKSERFPECRGGEERMPWDQTLKKPLCRGWVEEKELEKKVEKRRAESGRETKQVWCPRSREKRTCSTWQVILKYFLSGYFHVAMTSLGLLK